MPLFMWFYVAGLSMALGVGIVLYFVVGGRAMPLLKSLFGEQAGMLWGRAFRLTLVAYAMIGGLATSWYGCHGYSDYQHIAQNKEVMFQKTTEQVSGAMHYAVDFLLFVATVGAVMYAVLRRTSGSQRNEAGDAEPKGRVSPARNGDFSAEHP